jgi:hypothetical protein
MSDQWSSSGSEQNRFEPLPNTDTGGDLGTGASGFGTGMTDETARSSGRSRGTAGGPGRTTESNLGDKTSNPANFSGSGTGSSRSTSSSTGGAQDKARDAMDKAKGTMDQVQHKAGELSDQASAKASQMGDQATQKADQGKDMAADKLHQGAEMLRDRTQSMGDGQMSNMATMAAERLDQGAEFLRSKDTEQLITELEGVIRRRPVESLLVAVGAGYLLSRAL